MESASRCILISTATIDCVNNKKCNDTVMLCFDISIIHHFQLSLIDREDGENVFKSAMKRMSMEDV